MWGKGDKVIKVPFANGSRDESLSQLKLGWYIAPSKPIKAIQIILKMPNKRILFPMVLETSDVYCTYSLGLDFFGLKFVFICYINHSKNLPRCLLKGIITKFPDL